MADAKPILVFLPFQGLQEFLVRLPFGLPDPPPVPLAFRKDIQ